MDGGCSRGCWRRSGPEVRTFQAITWFTNAEARELETDDDSERFKERLGKLEKHKPVEKPE